MSDTLTDTTGPDTTGRGADEGAAAGGAHGRHRGLTAPDDTPAADPHGRHRLGPAERG
ncbi:hypothetical protein [Kitasatospora sp. NPDC057223]|uniref:hypothetical protein n=1 Tax=Kitasatospora sp. NPDC057223 TaxID=3346055 RepID=UPI0036254CCD